MSKFRAKVCKFEYAPSIWNSYSKGEGGSDSSFFVGGMRPFMYMGGGGERGEQTNIRRCSGSIQWFVYGGGV